jgi:ABC-type Fe3+-hydroxamate transport system substrate-binding protein
MPPRMRIVSLCPSLTELVFALERGDELVGITEWCVHPKGAVDLIEKVGGTKSPRVARIVELAPDIVLMNSEENRREDAEALRAAGLRVHATFPRDVEETAELVRDVGDALGKRCDAERIAVEIERRAQRVRDAARGLPPVTWAYLIWRKPYMTVNRDTFADAMLSLAGGRNVFAAREPRYAEVTAAELAAAAPQRVFLCTEPFPFAAEHADELAKLTGLPRERFVIADGEFLSWHGSRTPDGIDYAESLVRAARGIPS